MRLDLITLFLVWLRVLVLAADSSVSSASFATSSTTASQASSVTLNTGTGSQNSQTLTEKKQQPLSSSISYQSAGLSPSPTSSQSVTLATQLVGISTSATVASSTSVYGTATIDSAATTSSVASSTTSTSSRPSQGPGGGSSLSTKIFIAIGAILGAVAIVAPTLFLCKWHRRRRREQEEVVEEALKESHIHEEVVTNYRRSLQSSRRNGNQQHSSVLPSETEEIDYLRTGHSSSPLENKRESQQSRKVQRQGVTSMGSPDLYSKRNSWQTAEYHRTSKNLRGKSRGTRWSMPETIPEVSGLGG